MNLSLIVVQEPAGSQAASSVVGGMSPEQAVLYAALIALAGVMLSAIVSFFMSQRTIYINTVTAERTKWVGKLRENIAEISSLTRAFRDEFGIKAARVNITKQTEAKRKINELISTIKLQLNPSSKVDENIILLIEKMPSLADDRSAKLEKFDNLLVAHAQWLLKEEWERIKAEASWFGGGLRSWRVWRANRRYAKFSRHHPIEGGF